MVTSCRATPVEQAEDSFDTKDMEPAGALSRIKHVRLVAAKQAYLHQCGDRQCGATSFQLEFSQAASINSNHAIDLSDSKVTDRSCTIAVQNRAIGRVTGRSYQIRALS